MQFEFGKYTEITDYVFEVNPELKNQGFHRFFICPDVWDTWFVRILKGYENDDEQGYVENPNNYILERNNVPNNKKAEPLSLSKVKKIIQEDDGSNWDLEQGEDIEVLVDMLDDGFGIINRKQ